MTQIFRPRSDLLLRLGVLAALVGGIGIAAAWHGSLGQVYGVGEAVEQPIPFSHKHHVADDGIDCRYCHTTVTTASFAGIPPTYTCMTCHSQLFKHSEMLAPLRASLRKDQPLHWNRVYQLPDFVYFDHSIHVNKGVGCETCHGRVDRMPLTWRTQAFTMRQCLDCHRAPEQFLRPREHVFDIGWSPKQPQAVLGKKLIAQYNIHTGRLLDCSVCHR